MSIIRVKLMGLFFIVTFLTACQDVERDTSIIDHKVEHDIDINKTQSKKTIEERFLNRDSCDLIIDKVYFKICYDYSFKSAKSVIYKLEGDLVDELNIKERPRFYAEPLIDEPYRVYSYDYSNSGYDRGHLAPDAAFDWSQESLEATYSLANIVPQDKDVNQHQWVKVEEHARKEAKLLDEINVLNIVIFSKDSKRIGKDKIAVAKGFYKVIYNIKKNYKECFYYENNATLNDNSLYGNRVDCKKALDI